MHWLTLVHGLLISSADHVLEPGIDLPGSPFIEGHGLAPRGLLAEKPMNTHIASRLKHVQSMVLTTCISIATSPAMAQVTVSSGGGGWVANKLNILYAVLTGITGLLMIIAWTFAGYKFMYHEQTKLTDLKGLFIGGLCCGGASYLSSTMLS